MQRLISGVLAALMLLAPVAEAKVLVISSKPVNAGEETHGERAALGVLNSFGVDYDFIRSGAARTEYCRLGVRTIGGPGGTTTQSYDAVIHLGFSGGANPTTSGYRPDSLTRCNGTDSCTAWPKVPQLFAGVMGVPGNGWGDPFTSCSTGIRTLNPALGGVADYYKQYVVGRNEVWAPTGVVLLAANQSDVGAGAYTGIWRPLIGQGVGASKRARALPLATSACSDCDSVGRSNAPDSVVMWARYRSPSDAHRPLVFVDYGAFPQLSDPALFAMAVAFVDSATGGRIITKKQKMAVTIGGLYNVGHYGTSDGQQDSTRTGIFCRADSCDTLNIAATMDSLETLGVPITFSVEADSLMYVAKSYAMRLIQRVSRHRVAITSNSGTAASQRTGNEVTGRYHTTDIFGHTRNREVLPSGTTSLPTTCSDGDSSIYCLLAAAKARADSVFPGRVSKVLMADKGDWTPSTITRANATALDTLLWAYVSLGFRGAVSGVMSPQHRVGRSTLARGPFGWVANDLRLSARKPYVSNAASGGTPISSPIIGTFKILPTRGTDTYSAFQAWLMGNSGGHDVYQEEATGMWTRDWYPAHDVFHANHQMDVRTRVVRMDGPTLGGSGPGTHAPRAAWWHIKWHVNRFKAINAFAGRTVAEVVTLDELALDD